VRAADEAGVQLWEIDLTSVDPALGRGAYEALSVMAALAARAHRGGTAPEAVADQVASARKEVDAYR
jgi:argininosuccinate lyase